MTIARHYDETKNPEGVYLPGVPLRDIEQEAFDAYPVWLQLSIDACGFYRKSKPAEQARPTSKPDKE
jgi:hypothetical protein